MQQRTVTIVGMGPGGAEHRTPAAAEILARCDGIVGSPRLLEGFQRQIPKLASASPKGILEWLEGESRLRDVAVAVSGDVGFYSLAQSLRPLLAAAGYRVDCVPGISSLSHFCARLGTPWQDAKVLSLHGREGNLLSAVLHSPKVFLLTDRQHGPGWLCGQLLDWGLQDVTVSVGEHLSYPQERIRRGSPQELLGDEDGDLAVVLVENPHPLGERTVTTGLPDSCFYRGSREDGRPVPMTKSEVRSVILSKLRLHRGDTVYDVGAGTGSVSVEMALCASAGQVYAIEREPAAVALIEENRRRFGLPHITVCHGTAPEALEALPAPDAVFVGGSTGELAGILEAVCRKNPQVRLVVSAVTLETLHQAHTWMERQGLPDLEVVSLAVTHTVRAGGSHMLQAQNPIYIISAGGRSHDC